MHDERDHGQDDQQMNQSTGDMKREETEHPGDQENHPESKQHKNLRPVVGAGTVPTR